MDPTIRLMNRTHLILDGIQDPVYAGQLSKRWTEQGYDNVVDVSGQYAWLSIPESDGHGSRGLTEAEADQAATTAGSFGLSVRDRVGNAYVAENDLGALCVKLEHEYRSRLATALVFGLPALALHYAGPILAGGAVGSRGMLYPWLLEMLLVGWACIAAGWPVLWQGGLSIAHLRATGDMLTTFLLAWGFLPSVWLVLSLAGTNHETESAPMFHAVTYTLLIALLQRWLIYRYVSRLTGRADWMLRGFGRIVFGWVLLSIAVSCVVGWPWGLAVAMLMPPMMSVGAIHPTCTGWTALLPVLAFAGVILIGPGAFGLDLNGVEIETAAGFGLLMVGVFRSGWRMLPTQAK